MVWVGNGTPEGDARARRKNVKLDALKDQAEAHIRDFYLALTPQEKSDLRDFLKSYVKLKSNRTYFMQFGALRQRLDRGVVRQSANADVMAGLKSFSTVDQILAVVKEIEPLD